MVINKKRIAIIVPGGVGNGFHQQGLPALVNLITGLSSLFDVTVYSMVSISKEFNPDHFKIRSIRADKRNWTPWRMAKVAIKVLRDHRKNPFDLFHGFWGGPSGMIAVYLAKWLDCPSVVSLQGGETAALKNISYGQLLNKTKKKWLFRTLHAADKVTALTQFQLDSLKNNGFRNKDISVIPAGVDITLFTPSVKPAGPPYHFLHIANLTEVKDQETLLRAFRMIRDQVDCDLKIIGTDYLGGKIQKLSAELKLEDSVSFAGPVKNTELPHYFSQAHVLLHTSLYEAQGVVVAEAAASKVMIAGTKVGLISDLEHGAVAVAPGDYKELASRLLNILNEEKERQKTIQNAYNWAKTHDINYTVNEFINIYIDSLK